MKHFLVLALLLIKVNAFIVAQEFLNLHDLIRQLKSTSEDTNRVLLYIRIGQQYENNHPDSAVYYYVKARDLSEQLRYVTGEMKYLSNITYVFNAQSKYDTALMLNLRSVELAETHGTSEQLAACLGNVANSYLYLEMYESAIDYFLKASELIEKVGNNQYQCVLYNNLSIIYLRLSNPAKSREFAERAVKLARETNDQYNLGVSLDNLALTLINSGDTRNALIYLEEGLNVAIRTDNILVKESILINLADIYRRMGEFDKIKIYAEEAIKLAKQLEDPSGEVTAYIALGYYYLFHDQLEKASDLARLSEDKAESAHLKEQLANVYDLIGNISLVSGLYFEFQNYMYKHDSMENLVLNDRILDNIQDLETKYETGKKVQQISQLEKDKAIQGLRLRQNRLILLILGGISFTILVVGLLLFLSYRQKQLILNQENELHERRIVELETEKHLSAIDAVLKGQDTERTRLARDLHDGLGGILSGIKLSFTKLKESINNNRDDQLILDRSLDMLDGSIKEMRRIAHNLMPETLLKFGLDTALRDYCDNITDTKSVSVSYQSIGLHKLKTDQIILTTIYRILQELINNTVKHASANNIFVQLAYYNDHLTISVEDDGKGFDITTIKDSPGIGWSNIQNRVEYLKGSVDVKSEKEKGTTVNIDLEI